MHGWLVSYSTYSRISLCRSLHFSLSPQLSTQCWSPLWGLATLASLDSQLHFHTLGRQALPGFLLPVPPPGNSQGSKLANVWLMSFVSCLLGITVFHYLLSKNFSANFSYILLGFYYFIQKAKSGPFYSHLD